MTLLRERNPGASVSPGARFLRTLSRNLGYAVDPARTPANSSAELSPQSKSETKTTSDADMTTAGAAEAALEKVLFTQEHEVALAPIQEEAAAVASEAAKEE